MASECFNLGGHAEVRLLKIEKSILRSGARPGARGELPSNSPRINGFQSTEETCRCDGKSAAKKPDRRAFTPPFALADEASTGWGTSNKTFRKNYTTIFAPILRHFSVLSRTKRNQNRFYSSVKSMRVSREAEEASQARAAALLKASQYLAAAILNSVSGPSSGMTPLHSKYRICPFSCCVYRSGYEECLAPVSSSRDQVWSERSCSSTRVSDILFVPQIGIILTFL